MPIIMKLISDAFGNPTGFEGQYLMAFDFEAHDGQGLIDMTPDQAQAKVFADLAEAFAYAHTSPECKPTRDDGKPNRPLTATTWEFVRT